MTSWIERFRDAALRDPKEAQMMLDAVSREGSKHTAGKAKPEDGDGSQEDVTGKNNALAKKLESRLSPEALRRVCHDLTPYLLGRLDEISLQTRSARGLSGIIFAGAGDDVRRSIRGVKDALKCSTSVSSIERLKKQMAAATSWNGPEKVDLHKVLTIVSFLVTKAPVTQMMVVVGANDVEDRVEVVPTGKVDDDTE